MGKYGDLEAGGKEKRRKTRLEGGVEKEYADKTKTKPEQGVAKGSITRRTYTNTDERVRIMKRGTENNADPIAIFTNQPQTHSIKPSQTPNSPSSSPSHLPYSSATPSHGATRPRSTLSSANVSDVTRTRNANASPTPAAERSQTFQDPSSPLQSSARVKGVMEKSEAVGGLVEWIRSLT